MTDHHDELVQQVRGSVVRGVVGALDDSGTVQTVSVQTHDDVQRTNVEVHQTFGFASNAPNPMATLVAVGADQNDLVALPLASGTYRFGNLAVGQSVVYDTTGARIHFANDGTSEWLAFALLHIKSQNVTIDVTTMLTINGPVTFNDGHVTFNSPVTFNADVEFADAVTFDKSVAIGGNLVVVGSVVAASVNGHS